MANFATKLVADLQLIFTPKTLNIALHSVMLVLCLIGSVIFVCDFFDTKTTVPTPTGFFHFWSMQSIGFWLRHAINFIKIKIIVPALILCYFYICVKQRIFQKLLKEDYTQKYNEKYTKIHKVQYKQDKKAKKQASLIEQSNGQSSISDSRKDLFSKQGDSSLNVSKDMVRSMSRSMIGSMRSAGNTSLTQSMIDKGNLSIRSSKVIQNVSKKIIQGSSGKDLSTLFDKGKNISQSFISASSSGIEGQDMKIRIKSKKYYDFINESQGQEFKKWYDEANSKYLQQLKADKQDMRSFYVDLMQLKRGLEKEFNCFLKEYKQNTEAVKECLVRFWSVKIQAFDSKKPFKTAYELSSLFKQNDDRNNLNLTKRQDPRDLLVNEKALFKRCASPREFIRQINRLKINLRNIKQKDFAQKELLSILSKRTFLNTLLNISTIQGELFSESQASKLKTIEKFISALTSNKIDIFTLSRNENEVTQMDLLEEYDIETIKEMVELRMFMLTFIVNKINLMSDQKHFKVKMKLAVTYDSGFLTAALNFFKSKHFAQIQCDKSFDNIFSHFNLKVFKSTQGQQVPKESIVYCKPGIDNSISVLLFLVKDISDYLSHNYRFDERLSFDDKRREESFRRFIESLYTNRRI